MLLIAPVNYRVNSGMRRIREPEEKKDSPGRHADTEKNGHRTARINGF
jgi:hypothetical protein